MIFTKALLTASFLVLGALSHPGEEHEEMTEHEHLSFSRRHLQARSCDDIVRRHIADRRSLRGTFERKRSLENRASGCVVTPEVTEGPYYIKDELVRNDLRENQDGLDVTYDIQVIDLSSCEPVTDVFVELWNANAEGEYSGYTSSQTSSPARRQAAGGEGGAGGGGGGGGSASLTDTGSWLRGGNVVDSNGNVTIISKFPGHYVGRTGHTHLMVHSNYTINDNGTIASTEGSLVHVGQFFFETDILDQVYAISPYSNDTSAITTNDEDSILAQVVAAGSSPYVQADMVGSTLSDGLYVYAAVIVDTSASYSVNNANFAPSFTYTASEASTTKSSTGSSSVAATSTLASSSNGSRSSSSSKSTASSATTALDSVVSVVATSGAERVVQSFTTLFGVVSMLLALL